MEVNKCDRMLCDNETNDNNQYCDAHKVKAKEKIKYQVDGRGLVYFMESKVEVDSE